MEQEWRSLKEFIESFVAPQLRICLMSHTQARLYISNDSLFSTSVNIKAIYFVDQTATFVGCSDCTDDLADQAEVVRSMLATECTRSCPSCSPRTLSAASAKACR